MGRYLKHPDWLALIVIAVLSASGMFVLATLDPGQVAEQLAFFVAGCVIMFLLARIDQVVYRVLPPYFYVLAIASLVLVYLFPAVRGSHRWFTVAGIQLQPSEFVKPVIMLFFAWLISVKTPRHLVNLPLHFIAFLIPFVLIFRQPDLGTGIIYAVIWIAMLLAGGLDLRLFFAGVLSLFIIVPWGWNHLEPYQKNRIVSFVNPAFDPGGAGYNALQATIAVGSGQLTGRGIGFGTQSHLRFLPEHHTDFIFASLVEEVGFLGAAFLLGFYLILFLRILVRVWPTSGDPFAYTYGIGLYAMLLAQVFINTGMNMGMLPITGITLPLVSYGGSSLISTLTAFGLFWAVNEPSARGSAVEIT